MAAAVAALAVRERALLRYSVVDGLTLDEIGAIYRAHKSSVSRWLTRARARLWQETRAALQTRLEPVQLDRLGVRYIDRITGDAVDDIARLVRPEVRGITGTIAAAHAAHVLSESMFELPAARVVARWGCLPPGTTVDPAAVEPAKEKSWILDLDMFSVAPMPFVVERVVKEAQLYAERIYTVFRWAVTDDFLVRYGGKP